jgi:hypothetical protein
METAKMPHIPTNGLKKMYLYTIEFYSVTKKNEILSFTSKWMEQENIILSEVSQAQKAKNRMFSLICGLQTQNTCSNITGHGENVHGGIGKEKEN